MAFVRWGPDSDVYVFHHINGYYCLMLIGEDGEHASENYKKVRHLTKRLKDLKDTGFLVPDGLFDRLTPLEDLN